CAVTVVNNAGAGLDVACGHRRIAVAAIVACAEPNARPYEVAGRTIRNGDIAGLEAPVGSALTRYCGPVRIAVEPDAITAIILETVDAACVHHARIDVAGFNRDAAGARLVYVDTRTTGSDVAGLDADGIII